VEQARLLEKLKTEGRDVCDLCAALRSGKPRSNH
jgi:hypothetical protein